MRRQTKNDEQKEICQAVLAAGNAQEEGPINGGDDVVEDDALLAPLSYTS